MKHLGQSKQQCAAKVQLSKQNGVTSTVWIVEAAQPYKPAILKGFVAKSSKAAVQPSASSTPPRDIVLDIAPPTVGLGGERGCSLLRAGRPARAAGWPALAVPSCAITERRPLAGWRSPCPAAPPLSDARARTACPCPALQL